MEARSHQYTKSTCRSSNLKHSDSRQQRYWSTDGLSTPALDPQRTSDSSSLSCVAGSLRVTVEAPVMMAAGASFTVRPAAVEAVTVAGAEY